MAKCPHCPVRDEDRPCKAEVTGHLRFCTLADPDDPAYSPAYVAKLKGEAPTLLERAGYLASAVASTIASGGETVSDEERERRLAICRGCEHYDDDSQRCRRCTCYMPLKARLAALHCPLETPKW